MSGRLSSARARIRRSPPLDGAYRVLIAVLGAAIIVVGLLLVPLPGPGWVIVFGGIGLWATEFTWAARLARYGRRLLRRWTAWLRNRTRPVKAALAAGTVVVLAGLAWAFLAVSGVPGWFPEPVISALVRLPGVG